MERLLLLYLLPVQKNDDSKEDDVPVFELRKEQNQEVPLKKILRILSSRRVTIISFKRLGHNNYKKKTFLEN